MIDTLAVQWNGVAWNPEIADWLREEYPTAHFHQAAYDVGTRLDWQGGWRHPAVQATALSFQ